MAESDEVPVYEGWSVAARPAAIAALAVPIGLLALLLLAGWAYDRTIRPKRQLPVVTFPAPGIETFIHDGTRDPHRPRPAAAADARVEAAKRAVAAEGLVGWPR